MDNLTIVEDQRPLCLLKPHPHNEGDQLVGVILMIALLMLVIKFGQPPKTSKKSYRKQLKETSDE